MSDIPIPFCQVLNEGENPVIQDVDPYYAQLAEQMRNAPQVHVGSMVDGLFGAFRGGSSVFADGQAQAMRQCNINRDAQYRAMTRQDYDIQAFHSAMSNLAPKVDPERQKAIDELKEAGCWEEFDA